MATVIDLEQTHADLLDVYNRAAAGEDIVIARGKGPKLKLVAEPGLPSRGGKRKLGTLEGRIKETPGVWDPMTDDELREIGLL
ncbi:hypothetical protein [uncultured Sphingomonas sp.]|uniref:hypothetical protein n=1 Tax=uncultured Sphingomonas sp. TaxID=158754 RepID=UPI0035C976FA